MARPGSSASSALVTVVFVGLGLCTPAGPAALIPQAVVDAGTFQIGGGETLAVEHGRFTVPANRHAARPGTLTLRYVRFKTTAARPAAPIVFLAGGPGDAATRAFRGMPRAWLDPLLAIADVVAFDQRGTGISEPTGAMCAPEGAAPLDAPLDPKSLLTVLKARLAPCLLKIAAAGVDVGGFTTEESADDVNDLRVAMGARHIMILAGSYGTHLALAVARRHPEAIVRMALLGVEGPDDTVKLPGRVEATLAEIDAVHAGTMASLRTLIERLRREPWTKVLPNRQRVTVGAWDLQRRVAESLDTRPEIDALPAALAGMMGGDYSDLIRWTIPFRGARPINVMNVAMDCASFASSTRLAQVRTQASSTILGETINFPLPGICDVAGLPRLPDSFRSPIASGVPALLISGTWDGRTPPATAEAVATGMPRSRLLVIPRASHSLFREPTALEGLLNFFRD